MTLEEFLDIIGVIRVDEQAQILVRVPPALFIGLGRNSGYLSEIKDVHFTDNDIPSDQILVVELDG